jgi:hypothetical protein
MVPGAADMMHSQAQRPYRNGIQNQQTPREIAASNLRDGRGASLPQNNACRVVYMILAVSMKRHCRKWTLIPFCKWQALASIPIWGWPWPRSYLTLSFRESVGPAKAHTHILWTWQQRQSPMKHGEQVVMAKISQPAPADVLQAQANLCTAAFPYRRCMGTEAAAKSRCTLRVEELLDV